MTLVMLEMPKPQSKGAVRGLMYVATDLDGYIVCWSIRSHSWMLEHSKVGLVKTFTNLVAALSALERYSGRPADGFIMFNNPYN